MIEIDFDEDRLQLRTAQRLHHSRDHSMLKAVDIDLDVVRNREPLGDQRVHRAPDAALLAPVLLADDPVLRESLVLGPAVLFEVMIRNAKAKVAQQQSIDLVDVAESKA